MTLEQELRPFRTPCPHCLSRDVNRSRRRGAIDHLLGLFLFTPQRCNSCLNRFYEFRPARLTHAEPVR